MSAFYSHRFFIVLTVKKIILSSLFLIVFSLFINAQKPIGINPQNNYKIFSDISYGENIRNTFDLYLPDNIIEQIPLVVFFHGGSFKKGDKKQLSRQHAIISNLLDANIAFASVNYRFSEKNDSLGVQKCINDAVQFIQFIRLHANEFSINKNKIGSYGESSGAGISLYLAFHNDLAMYQNPELLKHESSRIQCVGAIATQASYNLLRWRRYIPALVLIYPFLKPFIKDPLANFYGYETYKQFKNERSETLAKLDMLTMISPDDPPIWVCNSTSDQIKKGIPVNANQLFHHPAHAKRIQKYAQKAHLPCYVITNETERASTITIDSFFIKYLLTNQ